MRHLPWMSLLVAGVLAGLAFPTASATDTELEGAWVGFTEEFGSFFRLELEAGGDGLLANASRARGDVRVFLYRVEQWSVEGPKIRLEFSPLDPDTPAIRAKGKLSSHEIDLEVARKGSSSTKRLRLYRESRLDEDLRLLRERVAAAGEE